MTLSGWFREYVYIPLGGNRKGRGRQLVNILIVWMLTGIWHGAGVNFLMWGLWFALFLILEKIFWKKWLEELPGIFGALYTCLVVLFGWVMFELPTWSGILGYVQAMVGLNGAGLWDAQGLFLGREYLILFLAAGIGATPVLKRMADRLENSHHSYAMAIYRLAEKVIPAVLLYLSIAYVVDASYNPFLYFRF